MTTLAEALATHASLPLPTTALEHWRYGRIDGLDLETFDVSSGSASVTWDAPDGVTISRDGPAGDVRGDAADAIDQLHDALALDRLVIEVEAGVTVASPVVVTVDVDVDGGVVFPHIVLRAGADSEVALHVVQRSGDVSALVVSQVEIDVGDAARVRYLDVQQLGARVWQLARQSSRVGADATFVAGMVALGGDYARLAIDSSLVGKGGSGELLAVSFGEGTQMHDFRTHEAHVAPSTTSNMLFKGAVEDHARAVYTGMIHIGKQAKGSRAFQTNRNIKLSEGARVESVPNLEIENNDVRCSHASAVGPVDEEQLFYLESRGVPTDIAERLVVLGFFEEVLERLPVQTAAPELRVALATKLDRRQA
jgi:Fe-S cluster assembly protein SufD